MLRGAARGPGRGRHARGAARARVGREPRPALQHRPHDRHDPAPQARRPAAHRDGPRERLPRVIPALRVRLTAIYGGVLFVFVALLLGVSYSLMSGHLHRTLPDPPPTRARPAGRALPARAGRRHVGRRRRRLGPRRPRTARDADRLRRPRALRRQRLARAALPLDGHPHRGRRDAGRPRRRRRRVARHGRRPSSTRSTNWTHCSTA